ncbi:MAG TPA: YbaK/EbsC family protein [Lacipirellulaceae bacterium]|nr:YbaK/EbsC family protein [Lacipirellulaceae bacterium]
MNVTKYLEQAQYEFVRVPHRPTYGAQHLAHELHVSGAEVAKTVLLRANGDYTFIVAVLPANRQIDLQAASKLFGGAKMQLATEVDIAQHCPDCDFGVLPPFGSKYGMKTIVDSSLAKDEDIWFEGNTHDEAIRMKFVEYCKLEQPLIAPFTKE